MILSRREQLIIVAAAIVVALLVLDRYAVTPLLDYRDGVEVQKQRLLGETQRATALLAHKRQIAPTWKEITATSLKRDPTEAESQILHAVQNWSAEAGLKLTSLKPERLIEKKSLREISFQAAGTGSMSAVVRFLRSVETAKVPIRVKELQLGSRKEGSDDLTLQLRVSTLYMAAQTPASSEAAAPPAPTGERE